MKEEVIKHLRKMLLDYNNQKMWNVPALVPEHMAEFDGYTALLESILAETTSNYEKLEAQVQKAELEAMNDINKQAEKREERQTQAETELRIGIRLADAKAERKRLEILAKSCRNHVTVVQSLTRRHSDEAKGVS